MNSSLSSGAAQPHLCLPVAPHPLISIPFHLLKKVSPRDSEEPHGLCLNRVKRGVNYYYTIEALISCVALRIRLPPPGLTKGEQELSKSQEKRTFQIGKREFGNKDIRERGISMEWKL